MIEVCDDCDYTVMIADLIATLMTLDKHNEKFTLKIWISNTELPFPFESNCHFDFLQEGLRVDDLSTIRYLFYDIITLIEVVR